jgi:hypothetical protein
MRDVYIVTAIYCLLFVILTTPAGYPAFGMSAEIYGKVHHFMADIIFWAAALYICASGTYGAFARQDRFGLSQNHPLFNRFLSLLLLLSPFLAVLWNVRFVYVLLGLLLFSHVRSKTEEEKNIDFTHSRSISNLALIAFFTLAMMLMAGHDYKVGSILNWGSTANTTIEQDVSTIEQQVKEED